MTDLALDDVNKQIIEHLQRDGRMSYAGLAKIIGLSEAAVRSNLADGSLVRLLPDHRMAVRAFSNGVYAVFRQSRTLPLKVRAFVDFAAEALRDTEAPPGTP